MKLNLPNCTLVGENAARVKEARARASRISAEILDSIPEISAEELRKLMDSLLAPGTIASLEEASDLTGIPRPYPYREDIERRLNVSGYTIANNLSFKLDSSLNVEALRMLYVAGMSIGDIRKALQNLVPGDTYVLKCGKKINVFPKADYRKLLHETDLRFYKAYVSDIGDYTYVVSDSVSGSDSIFAVACFPDTNSLPYLICSEASFPINGTMSVYMDGVKNDITVNAENPDQLTTQLATLGFTCSYKNGLTLKYSKPFKFVQSDICEKAGIKAGLTSLANSVSNGYTGGSLGEGNFPYNITVQKPTVSSYNYRKIVRSLEQKGVPSNVTALYLAGDSLYANLQPKLDSIGVALSKVDVNNTATFTQVDSSVSSAYSEANVRILSITPSAITRLLALSDSELEYILRYRVDILGIDPYTSNEEATDSILNGLSTNTGGTYTNNTRETSDPWIQNNTQIRYVVASWENIKNTDKSTAKKNLNLLQQFSSSMQAWTTYSVSSQTTLFQGTDSNALNIAMAGNAGIFFNLQGGLKMFANLNVTIPDLNFQQFEDFMAGCAVVQAYMDSAYNTFMGIVSRVSGVMNILNSSIPITLNTSLGINGLNGILQCSISPSLNILIPPILSFLNKLLEPIIDLLIKIVEAIQRIVDALLCPIQTALDTYFNSNNLSIPCSLNISIPVISGLSSYIGKYLAALKGLKALCNTTRADVDWLTASAGLMPGRLELIATDSANCSES